METGGWKWRCMDAAHRCFRNFLYGDAAMRCGEANGSTEVTKRRGLPFLTQDSAAGRRFISSCVNGVITALDLNRHLDRNNIIRNDSNGRSQILRSACAPQYCYFEIE